MYSIVVVDDEKNIREGIVELVNWKELGCKVCASMHNGEQVIRYLEKENEKIDIVITDIKMPIMDGMELAGILYDRYPSVKVIILTAYSDFTYAQQAIKFQVADYVVKNDFFSELPRAVKKIIKQKERKEKDWKRKTDRTYFSEDFTCRVCACEIKSIKKNEFEMCKKRLEKILDTVFEGYQTVVLENENELLIFVVEHKISEENEIWFQKKLEKVVFLAKTFQNMTLRVGASEIVKSADSISTGKKQAVQRLSEIYTDKNPVNVKDGSRENTCDWSNGDDAESYMRRLYIALRNKDVEGKKKSEEEFETYLKCEAHSIEQCRADAYAIILYLTRKLKNTEKYENVLMPERVLNALYRSKSKVAISDVMRDACSLLAMLLEKEKVRENSLSGKVNHIIERSYQGKLSLKDISKELFVNSSYLSRVYKKETGDTVTDAINKYRIKKAKEILETGEYRIYEVGKLVGIEDAAYFTHVFLKYEGKNPSDFLNKQI